MRTNRSDTQDPTFQVISPSKPDYRLQKVACVFCASIMKWLTGMPQGHGQWICENCGSLAYEGYGDTPAHNTDPDSNIILSPNDPYPTGPTGLDGGFSRPVFKDLTNESGVDTELDEEFDELKPPPGRPRIRHVSDHVADVKRRYGMFHDIRTAEEASGLI